MPTKNSKTSTHIKKHAAAGGKARAESLTSDERSEIARRAVRARWKKAGKTGPVPKATHEGVLCIGESEIPCAVLDNDKRVITQSGMMVALNRARQAKGRDYYDADVNLPAFLTAKNLKPFIPKDLEVTSSQVEFQPLRGGRAFGYSADLLPKVCDVFLEAKMHGALHSSQAHVADKALILIRGFARVGIIALVDEATGYQYERAKTDLQKYLEEFLSEELRRWVKTFPDEYVKQICRLRDVPYRPDMRLPQYFGHLTNDVVYKRLAPYVLEELKRRNEADEKGRRSSRHHQWLNESVGHPKLLQHLGLVVGLMKISNDWDGFKSHLDLAAPSFEDSPLLADALSRD